METEPEHRRLDRSDRRIQEKQNVADCVIYCAPPWKPRDSPCSKKNGGTSISRIGAITEFSMFPLSGCSPNTDNGQYVYSYKTMAENPTEKSERCRYADEEN